MATFFELHQCEMKAFVCIFDCYPVSFVFSLFMLLLIFTSRLCSGNGVCRKQQRLDCMSWIDDCCSVAPRIRELFRMFLRRKVEQSFVVDADELAQSPIAICRKFISDGRLETESSIRQLKPLR